MSEILDRLLHRRILRVERVHDYMQIYFDDCSILNIFNTVRISGGQLGELTNCEIMGSDSDAATASLLLSNGGAIHIGISDADYSGPEAMEYIPASGLRIVWR